MRHILLVCSATVLLAMTLAAAGAAEPERKRQTFNVLDMSFEIPARGWELLNETESGVELLLKYGDRRGEMIAIDRVLFPPKLRRFSRKQHASTFFQMERRKRRYEGTRWEGFTEGERQIGERVYPTMSFRVTRRNVGMTQDGLFLLYFPEDFTEKQRFFSLMWTDTHPTDAEGRGLAEFDAFVSGLQIRSLGDGVVARHIMPPGEIGWKQALFAADKALKQQDYAEAEQLLLFALKEAETFGPQDRRLAQTLNNLAYLYNAQRTYGKAEPLYMRSLAIYEGMGEENARLAQAAKTLAHVYHYGQGKLRKAEPLYKRSLAVFEKAVGAEHPVVAGVLNDMAGLYRQMKKYDEVESLYMRALAIFEKANHPAVKTIRNNIEHLRMERGAASR